MNYSDDMAVHAPAKLGTFQLTEVHERVIQALFKMGVDNHVINQFWSAGFFFEIGDMWGANPFLEICHPHYSKTSVGIKPGPLHMLFEGTLPTGLFTDAIRLAFETKMKAVLKLKEHAQSVPTKSQDHPKLGELLETVDTVVNEEAAYLAKTLDALSSQMKQETQSKAPKKVGVAMSKKIPLSQATELLQAVKGTDSSSVYCCIALGDRYNVAARLVGATISIRAERKPEKYFTVTDKITFSQLDMQPNVSENHYSVHALISPPLPHNVQKTIGAYLFSMETGLNKKIAGIDEFLKKNVA
jgi:predicted transcriptional regulator with HTH domain